MVERGLIFCIINNIDFEIEEYINNMMGHHAYGRTKKIHAWHWQPHMNFSAQVAFIHTHTQSISKF